VEEPHVGMHLGEANNAGYQGHQEVWEEQLKIEILQHCTSQEDTDAAEIHFATTLSTFVPKGYNLRAGKARGVMIEEVRLRIGQGNQGKMPSLAARQNMSKAHTGVPFECFAAEETEGTQKR